MVNSWCFAWVADQERDFEKLKVFTVDRAVWYRIKAVKPGLSVHTNRAISV